MIYFEQSFNLDPASPAQCDAFVSAAQEVWLPTMTRLGGRLRGAWFNHAEWFQQVTQVVEFDDLAAFDAFRRAAAADAEWKRATEHLAALAPTRRDNLLEPFGPVATATLEAGIARAAEKPAGAYTYAILEILPGRLEEFRALLAAGAASVPILAAWTPVAGNPNLVIDLWRGALGQDGYAPADPGMDAGFFAPLRKIAPRERLVNLYPLPYSPLQ